MMADEILGGVLTSPKKLVNTPGMLMQEQEVQLPEVTPGQHEAILSHVLGEGKRMDAIKTAAGRAKSYVTGKKDFRNIPRAKGAPNQRPGHERLKTAREVDPESKSLGVAPARTLKGDLKSLAGRVKKFAKKVVTPSTPAELKAMGHQDRKEGTTIPRYRLNCLETKTKLNKLKLRLCPLKSCRLRLLRMPHLQDVKTKTKASNVRAHIPKMMKLNLEYIRTCNPCTTSPLVIS